MKLAAIISIITILIGGLLFIFQVWFDLLSPDLFFKIMLSLGIFLFLFVICALIRREYIEDTKLKKDGYLD